jgi:hypothetical protein
MSPIQSLTISKIQKTPVKIYRGAGAKHGAPSPYSAGSALTLMSVFCLIVNFELPLKGERKGKNGQIVIGHWVIAEKNSTI